MFKIAIIFLRYKFILRRVSITKAIFLRFRVCFHPNYIFSYDPISLHASICTSSFDRQDHDKKIIQENLLLYLLESYNSLKKRLLSLFLFCFPNSNVRSNVLGKCGRIMRLHGERLFGSLRFHNGNVW